MPIASGPMHSPRRWPEVCRTVALKMKAGDPSAWMPTGGTNRGPAGVLRACRQPRLRLLVDAGSAAGTGAACHGGAPAPLPCAPRCSDLGRIAATHRATQPATRSEWDLLRLQEPPAHRDRLQPVEAVRERLSAMLSIRVALLALHEHSLRPQQPLQSRMPRLEQAGAGQGKVLQAGRREADRISSPPARSRGCPRSDPRPYRFGVTSPQRALR
jgi:hypothetical protein